MNKIVMFDGEIETQQYFTYQMREEFIRQGKEVFTFNLSKVGGSLTGLMRFIEKDNTALVCFNFHGISPGDIFQDEETGEWLWDAIHAPVYNIVVDHPYYYPGFLANVPKGYIHISIDKKHDEYMQRFYPQIKRIPFLPLAGTQLNPLEFIHAADLAEGYQEVPEGMSEQEYIRSILTPEGNLPIEARPIDIVFTGNYATPDKFDKYKNRNGEEYAIFYQEIVDDLIEHPWKTIEEAAEAHIRREIPEVTEAELKETFDHMIFIDLIVRGITRGKAVQVLVDSGLKVAVFGDGWNELKCEHPENLIDGGNIKSKECLEMIQKAKLSLNVMPWFKDGAHDRIFNTMLNGSALISDSSKYLEDILKDEEDCILFSLDAIEEMPAKVKRVLEHPEALKKMVKQGYDLAHKSHLWAHRAQFLMPYIDGEITVD